MTLLRNWQTSQLPILRHSKFGTSPYSDLTVVVYSYPRKDQEVDSFKWIEFSILQTWKCLGKIKTIIVVNQTFPAVAAFASQWTDVEIQEEPSLEPGSLWSMSIDCIKRLHSRFFTPYCLIIQDDGFPIRSNIADFIGKWDYIGAPAVTDGIRKVTDVLGLTTLNGGFSLRSRKICRSAAKSWQFFWRFFLRPGNRLMAEDVFYSFTAKLSPVYRLRHSFPPSAIAFRFSFDDLNGTIAFPKGPPPLGFHGKSTASYFLTSSPPRETEPEKN